ncbi:MAG: hypothetical protein EA374_07190 [Acholeplasmatales bacterium]|nr:MAG: hypothetical protein EA374_07190 [Acholeplasmatales bacterium]
MKIKRLLLLALIAFTVFTLTRIERYSLYIYHLDASYVSLNTEGEGRTQVASVPMTTCDTYVCIESLIEVFYNEQSRVYFMLATVTFEPLTDVAVDHYTMLHQIRVEAELDKTVDTLERTPRIINALMTNPLLDSHVGLDFHPRNVLGQRDFSDTVEKVGYRMTASLTSGQFRGIFDFYDVISSKTVATYFVYESSDLLDQNALDSVQVSVEYRHHMPQFLWFNDTIKETITHIHPLVKAPLETD